MAQETKTAQSAADPGICLIPLVAEPQITSPLLDEWIGVDITDPSAFEHTIDQLASLVLVRPATADRDAEMLRHDLATIVTEAPELRALIEPLAATGEVTYAQLGSVTWSEPLRHPAETALIMLHELADAYGRYVLSLVAGQYYWRFGVGYEVICRQISLLAKRPAGSDFSTDDLSSMLCSLGHRFDRPQDLHRVMSLFWLAAPPQDDAFLNFVEKNFENFDKSLRDKAVEFMLTPKRGPANGAIDVAFSLFSRMPDSQSSQTLWWFWVNDYKFGGRDGVKDAVGIDTFFTLMNRAFEEKLHQFDPIMDHFESRFGNLAKSSSFDDLPNAIYLLNIAVYCEYVHRDRLAKQLSNSLHSAEWNSRTREVRDLLYRPIWDLSIAVRVAQTYSDQRFQEALSAFTKTLDAARSTADPDGN